MPVDFKQDDYFKMDVECHILGDQEQINHFPGVKMWWGAVGRANKPLSVIGMPPEENEGLEPYEMTKQIDPAYTLEYMNKYGVDIACLLPESMMETTGYSSRWSTNGDAYKVVEKNPDRFIIQPNLSPIKFRGVKAVNWEMEYWVKEKGAKIFKFYPPEDTYINDPDLWPFYEKAQELGIVLSIHTGFSWVPPGKSKYASPILIDDVARDFPDLKIIAFHMGYPYCDELNMVAMGHPNVYLSLSLLVNWALCTPRKFAKILGEALRFVGPDKIIWGVDYVGFGMHYKHAVKGFRDFQIPEEMQKDYGYPAITNEIRRKIFGENLAGLLNIDPSIRRVNKK